jgi:hypothetical protein
MLASDRSTIAAKTQPWGVEGHVDRPSRRQCLQQLSCGFGWLAFAALQQPASGAGPKLAPASGLRSATAEHVIFISLRGGPSHVDTLDYKPQLSKADGQPGPRPGSRWLASPWKFSQHGESGLWFSSLLPHLAEHADRLGIVHSMQTDVPAHPQAYLKLHTGSSQFVRPSLGAWSLYGLGLLNQQLPGFVAISPASNLGGPQNYGNAFLPAQYHGMRLGQDNRPVFELDVPHLTRRKPKRLERLELDWIQEVNRLRLGDLESAKHIDDAIAALEMAFHMQDSLPEVLDISRETAVTERLYGLENPVTSGFGRKCMIARRLIEEGVRFVEITHGNWDHHADIDQRLPRSCQEIDRGLAGLLADLQQRGLLDKTLIVCSGEFGRTPYAQGRSGRDHNHQAFSLWMAGGPIRGGSQYGQSDPMGHRVAERPVSIADLHATLLAALGLDHTQLTYRHAGRDFRLTDVAGSVIDSLLV